MSTEVKKLGKYEIVSVLGKGAMGIVYKSIDPVIKREVAIKTIRSLDASIEEATLKERFVQEAQAAGRLQHPNIVAVYEYGEDGDWAYIAMEFVQGDALSSVLKNKPRFEVPQICDIMLSILRGLSYAHSNGVVHRDIKPSNIMLRDDGVVKLMDFGIARIESSNLTRIGTVLGTPGYMSPEQLVGKPVDHRSDLFSAGILLYELLTGEMAFDATSLTEVMYKVVHTKPAPPGSIRQDLPKAFDDIIDKALQKEPEQRYQTADEFIQAISDVLDSLKRGTTVGDRTVVRPVKDEPSASPGVASRVGDATGTEQPTRLVSGIETRPAGKKKLYALLAGLVGVLVLAVGGWLLVPQLFPDPSVTDRGKLTGVDTAKVDEKQAEAEAPVAEKETAAPPATEQRATPPAPPVEIAKVDEPSVIVEQPKPTAPEIAPSESTPTRQTEVIEQPETVPEPSFEIEPLNRVLIVASEGYSRIQPLVDADEFATLLKGDRVVVTGRVEEGDWYRISNEKGETAFVPMTMLREERASDRYRPGESIRDCDFCPELVVIPAGSATIGSPVVGSSREPGERPQHRVTLDYMLAVGRYEVTREEFRQFTEDTGYRAEGCKIYAQNWQDSANSSWLDPGYEQQDSHPATCISWNDAKAYVRWLSKKTKHPYRLPSSAEWEYVARAGTAGSRYWGDDNNRACRYGNVADGTAEKIYNGWQVHPCDDQFVHTAPVGSFRPNEFGVYDVLGNAFEWVEDCWNGNYENAPANGDPWTSGDCTQRVLRGGSWYSMPEYVRSAFRNRFDSNERSSTFGFRVARYLGK